MYLVQCSCQQIRELRAKIFVLEDQIQQSHQHADVAKFLASNPALPDHDLIFKDSVTHLVKLYNRKHPRHPFLKPLIPLRPLASTLRLSLAGSSSKLASLDQSAEPYARNVPSSTSYLPLLAPLKALFKTGKWTSNVTLALMAFMTAGLEAWRIENQILFDFDGVLEIPDPDIQEVTKVVQNIDKGNMLNVDLSVLGLVQTGEGVVLWTKVERTVTLYAASEGMYDVETASRVG